MRSPLNNPTERIGRLIEEFDEAMEKMERLYSAVAAVAPELLQDIGPMPRFPTLEAEKTRRSLTYSRSIYRNRSRKALDAVRTDQGATLAEARRQAEPLSHSAKCTYPKCNCEAEGHCIMEEFDKPPQKGEIAAQVEEHLRKENEEKLKQLGITSPVASGNNPKLPKDVF